MTGSDDHNSGTGSKQKIKYKRDQSTSRGDQEKNAAPQQLTSHVPCNRTNQAKI